MYFALDPTEGDCKGLAAWHIEKGHFTNGTTDGRNSNSNNNKSNSINIANLSIILAVHSRTYVYWTKMEDCSLSRRKGK